MTLLPSQASHIRSMCSNNELRNGNASGARPHEDNVGYRPVGIGVTVRRIRGLITVVDVKPDCPAATLLKKGQIILRIDGTGNSRRSPFCRFCWDSRVVAAPMMMAE
jgi:hypothetical protein